MMNSRKVDDFRHPERSSARAGCWGRQMVQDMVAEVRRENDVDTAPWKPRPLQRPHGGLLRVDAPARVRWRLSNLYCWLVLIRLRESSKACEMNQEYDRPHLDTSRTCHCVGEREKDTCYPASLFTPRLRTRAWGHFFTQLNTNTNGVDHWETWQHGTRKSEAESVCDKQGEIPPLILYPSYTLTSPFNTQGVINTVKPKLLSVF